MPYVRQLLSLFRDFFLCTLIPHHINLSSPFRLIIQTRRVRLVFPIMSAIKFCLSLTSKQASRHVPQVQCIRKATFRRNIHGSKFFAQEKKSFRTQLYESTAQRLARERAEQRRLAEIANRPVSTLGRTTSITFGRSLVSLESSSTDPRQ